MKTKKIAQATAIAAIAAAAWLGNGITNASAAESEPSPSPTVVLAGGIDKDDISFKENQMYIDGGQASQVIVGIGTEKNSKVKISSWDVYENIYKDAEFQIEAAGCYENYGNEYATNRYYNKEFRDSKEGKLLRQYIDYGVKIEDSSPDSKGLNKEQAKDLAKWLKSWQKRKGKKEIIETLIKSTNSDSQEYYEHSFFHDKFNNLNDMSTVIKNFIDFLENPLGTNVNNYNKDLANSIYQQEIHSYYYKGICVDLSKLNPAKDNCIAVKTESSDPIYIKIPASIKKQKIAFHADHMQLEITNIKSADSEEEWSVDDINWEYRTSSGNWKDLDLLDATWDTSSGKDTGHGKIAEDFYQYQGTSLYIRAANTLSSEKGGDWIVDTIKNEEVRFSAPFTSYHFFRFGTTIVTDASDKSGTKKYNMYTTTGRLPGKETKLNIPKQANGPSVGVDYAKGTVKIPKNTEYLVLADGEYLNPKDEYGRMIPYETTDIISTDASSLFTYKDEKGVEHTSSAVKGVLEVRKTRVSKGKGKAPSKWTIISIGKPVALTLSEENKKDTSVTTGSSVSLVSATGGAISADYQAAKKPAKDYKVTYANFSLTTTSDITYEYILSTDGNNKPAANAKAAKLTSKKAANIKKAKADGNYLWVRIAGDRKTKTWAGEYTNLGKITFPEDEKAS